MSIREIQARFRTIGRLRMGDKSEKGAPRKLDTWRLTSHSQPLIEAAAATWGGESQPWEGQWEVITGVSELPCVIPPQDPDRISFYELWSAGGLQRRCDGEHEQVHDTECVCDPENRQCGPITRVNIMLPDLPDVGTWLLSSTGWNAAVELNAMMALVMGQMRRTGWMPPATVAIEKREIKRPGQPVNRFVVPVIRLTDPLSEFIESGERPTLASPPSQGGALPSGEGEHPGDNASTEPPPPQPPPKPEAEVVEAEVVTGAPSDQLRALLGENPMAGTTTDIEKRTRDLYRFMANAGYWAADAYHAGLRKFLVESQLSWSDDGPEPGPHWSDLGRKVNQQAFAAKSFEAARRKVLGS